MNKDHPKINFGKTGILLINLGTPDSTNWWDIRRYLKEFLSDRRVIEVNPIIWQIILNLFILTFRPSKTAKAYKEIWMKDLNKSPLRFYTEMQSKKLSNKFQNENIIGLLNAVPNSKIIHMLRNPLTQINARYLFRYKNPMNFEFLHLPDVFEKILF